MNTEPGQLDDEGNAVTRPTAMVEVRAWIAFGVVTLIHIASGVWWASAVSAQLAHQSEQLTELKTDLKVVRGDAQNAAAAAEDKRMLLNLVADHEARLRSLERGPR
jgi:hypothetical protein